MPGGVWMVKHSGGSEKTMSVGFQLRCKLLIRDTCSMSLTEEKLPNGFTRKEAADGR